MDYLIFDKERERYVLTENAVENELGITLSAVLNKAGDNNPSTLPDRFLRRVSLMIYNFIEMHGGNLFNVNAKIQLYKQSRRAFEEALLQQVLFLVSAGDLGLQSGVNLRDGAVISRNDLRGIARISDDTYQILLNAGFLYCGDGYGGAL